MLPTVAPRDFGKGHGGRFDVEAFITGCGFDGPQVQALYAFLCFMAVVADEGVDEEQLPAIIALVSWLGPPRRPDLTRRTAIA